MNALVIVVVNARQFDGEIVPQIYPVRAAEPWRTVVDAWSAARDVRSAEVKLVRTENTATELALDDCVGSEAAKIDGGFRLTVWAENRMPQPPPAPRIASSSAPRPTPNVARSPAPTNGAALSEGAMSSVSTTRANEAAFTRPVNALLQREVPVADVAEAGHEIPVLAQADLQVPEDHLDLVASVEADLADQVDQADEADVLGNLGEHAMPALQALAANLKDEKPNVRTAASKARRGAPRRRSKVQGPVAGVRPATSQPSSQPATDPPATGPTQV